jgi:nucleotide-binding universal stress UspA family protein
MQRIVVATDRSETSERAVEWAADLASRFTAELLLVQVLAPSHADLAEGVRTDDLDGIDDHVLNAMRADLHRLAQEIAGPSGRARVVVDDQPAEAIVAVADEEHADVIVVGNAGMSGNKKFLLSNIPNRITHAAHCTVITVNTSALDGKTQSVVTTAPETDDELLLSGRAAKIASVIAKHGIAELFARRKGDHDGSETRETARRLRQAFEELGPTFCKLGQVLSTRPDLVPPEYIDELAALRDQVPPLTEAQVVEVMEEELRVPWDDV